MTIPTFQKKILSWYQKNGRDLPWRHTEDPYKILVSEIMLQQTQVSRVIPKYELFLKSFPTVESLSKTKTAKLLEVWSGLGYWRRAKFLKQTAIEIAKNHSGKFPKTPGELQKLPGIGPYTAGAVACFAFSSREPFIDTNIRRVYLHFFFPEQKDISDSEIFPIAKRAVPKNDPRRWGWALFDYGATELKETAINKRSRHYTKQSKFEGSFRSFRAKAVKKLLASPNQKLSRAELFDYLEEEIRSAEQDWSAEQVLTALQKDNLIKQNKNSYSL